MRNRIKSFFFLIITLCKKILVHECYKIGPCEIQTGQPATLYMLKQIRANQLTTILLVPCLKVYLV
nr:hypothetical protein Itr_chr03CG20240 [Ipomoea trifida]